MLIPIDIWLKYGHKNGTSTCKAIFDDEREKIRDALSVILLIKKYVGEN